MLDHIRGGERPSYDSVLPSCQNCTYTGGLLRKRGACRETISRQSIHFLCSCEVGACRLCVALEYKSRRPVGIRLWGGQFRDHALYRVQSASHFLVRAQLTLEFLTFSENFTSATSCPSLGYSLSIVNDDDGRNNAFPSSHLF